MKLKALLQLGFIAICLVLIAIPLSHVLVSQPVVNADTQALGIALVSEVVEDVEATDTGVVGDDQQVILHAHIPGIARQVNRSADAHSER